MENLLEQIFQLKKEGLNNTQIAKKLNIRRQDLVVIFKYLKNVNPSFFSKLEEIELLRKEYISLKNKAEEELEKAQNEVEHEMFVLNAKVNKYEQDLNEKEEKIKKLEEENEKINKLLEQCILRREKYKKDYINATNKFAEELNNSKLEIISQYKQIINTKNGIINNLEKELNNCKPVKCYIAKFFNILFLICLFGTLGAGGYFAYKYKLFNIKKKVYEEDWKDYKKICYTLDTFKTKYIKDYKYQFCYYKSKEKNKEKK
jgi:septal ring factor EnvC (AmiA/AmiB activator)